MRQKKRFVAGATCPKCHAMDSVMLYMEHQVEKIECVACGYQASQTDDKVSATQRDNEQVIGVFKPE